MGVQRVQVSGGKGGQERVTQGNPLQKGGGGSSSLLVNITLNAGDGVGGF